MTETDFFTGSRGVAFNAAFSARDAQFSSRDKALCFAIKSVETLESTRLSKKLVARKWQFVFANRDDEKLVITVWTELDGDWVTKKVEVQKTEPPKEGNMSQIIVRLFQVGDRVYMVTPESVVKYIAPAGLGNRFNGSFDQVVILIADAIAEPGDMNQAYEILPGNYVYRRTLEFHGVKAVEDLLTVDTTLLSHQSIDEEGQSPINPISMNRAGDEVVEFVRRVLGKNGWVEINLTFFGDEYRWTESYYLYGLTESAETHLRNRVAECLKDRRGKGKISGSSGENGEGFRMDYTL